MATPPIEKRAHRRLALKLPLTYTLDITEGRNTRQSVTENISTGGTYFKTALDKLNVGNKLSIWIDIDSTDRPFAETNQIRTVAEVIRISQFTEPASPGGPVLTRYGIALKFNQPLQITF